MSEITDLIRDYCGLTEGQWFDLKRLRNWEIKSMNGGRADALRDLITHHQFPEFTEYGIEVMDRARAIEGGFRPEVLDLEWPNTIKAANEIRKKTIHKWVSSPTMKLLWTLYTHPGMCWTALCAVYSYDQVTEVKYFGLAEGEKKRGAPWKLSEEGRGLVIRFCLEQRNSLIELFEGAQ